MRILIQEHKDKEINMKMHESFNVVRSILHTSTYERIFPLFLKTQSTRLEYQSIVTIRKNTKSQNPRMPTIRKKYLTKLLISQAFTSLYIPNNLYKSISLIFFPLMTQNIYRDIRKSFPYSIRKPSITII